MVDSRPNYLVGAPGPERDQVRAALGDFPIQTFDAVPALLGSTEPAEPGRAFLVGPALDPGAVLDAVSAMAAGRGEWTPVLMEKEGGAWVARTLSLGYPHPLEDVVGSGSSTPSSVLLELRAILAEISRARHDINNPLTSALAETQLLMMDDLEAETAESLQIILEQLRRIRDLVAATAHLRLLE